MALTLAVLQGAVLTLALSLPGLIGAQPAGAVAGPPPAGSTGHDVSYPQCSGTAAPTLAALAGQFGIVGVNDGLAFSTNPCLAAEYSWAAGRASAAALYLNTGNPAPTSSHYWPVSGASDPALCQNSSSTADPGCAYDYGWHAAADALATATAAIPAAASLSWWLDVETANSWNGDAFSNTADLQGAADYLRSHAIGSVGIYSSAGSWQTITGGYSTSTAPTYAAAWQPEFTPQFPLTQSPTWVAGAGTAANASATCSAAAFTGPAPQLAQYLDGTGFDADLVCGAAAPAPGGGGGGGSGGTPPNPPSVSRLFGPDRIETSIAIARDGFPTGHSAPAVVLTRSDGFADALAGAPLAAAKKAPMLLTAPGGLLDQRVSDEILRVLNPGGTVFVLGGAQAIDPGVDRDLAARGVAVVRFAGADRYATAVAIAHDGLSDPPTQLFATGTDFADALAGGAAAANVTGGAALLLTKGATLPPPTAAYMTAHPATTAYALGGPAASAVPSATAVFGADRFDTSVQVAKTFFPHPVTFSGAYGFDAPDALAGGPDAARRHGPLLLVDRALVPAVVDSYLRDNKAGFQGGVVYGGPAVVTDAVLAALQTAIS